MSLDADFKRHLGELTAEVSESLRRELEEHKRQLLWNARQTHNSAALPIAYSEASIYAFRTRVEKTIAKFLEALESCDIVVDGAVETEMLEIIRPLTVGVPSLMFPPGLNSPNLSAVQGEHARELIRVGSSLYRQAANRLREARIKATRRMSIIQEKAVLKSADDDVPTVFVSYSWDSAEHKEWVLQLSEELTVKGGARVILDQWDLRPGGDRTLFMERSVADSDIVLVICTPNYASKANQRTGGVGYEAMIITSQLARSVEQEKFIPVLRSGDWASSSPVWLQSKIGVDLSGNPYDQNEYEKLVRTLHDEHVKPPAVGPKPRFQERSGYAEASTATPAPATESANAAPDLERMPRPYLEVLDDTGTAFGRTAFVFTNRGGDVAHNVQVQPLSINHRTVTFDYINHRGQRGKEDITNDNRDGYHAAA